MSESDLPNNNNNNTTEHRRMRANTDQSEDTLEKMKLLETFPLDDEDEEGEHPVQSCSSSSSATDLFQQQEEEEEELDEDDAPPAKRRRVLVDTETRATDATLLTAAAKATLSKWTMRLFDSSRPRGLVETPQEIPLNDEFLKAFGQRHVKQQQQPIILSEENHSPSSSSKHNEDTQYQQTHTVAAARQAHGMVSIVNLAYATTAATIFKTCERYGPVIKIDLPLDPSSTTNTTSKPNPATTTTTTLSLGKATVVFEYPDDAARFVECMHQKTMEGRLIYCYLMGTRTGTGGSATAASAAGTHTNTTATTSSSSHDYYKPSTSSSSSRYFIKDITTKCFRCGQVGHVQGACTNPEKPKPCPLCTTLLSAENDTTGHYHNLKACPLSKVCFNCGSPGHINKSCPYKKGAHKRVVCTACLMEGHHRWSCPNRAITAVPCAKCMTCGTF